MSIHVGETNKLKLNIGSIVAMKHGGPLMTVTKLEHRYNTDDVLYTVVKCAWFGENNQPFTESYPEDALVHRKDT